MENFRTLVQVTRGNGVESFHLGALAVVDSMGRLIASFGDPYTRAFLRSSSKPFQTLPLVEMGGAGQFGLDETEIAITCASHSGTDEHKGVLEEMQRKVGLTETDLKCGTHPPMHEPTWHEMIRRGEMPTPNRHNCSGKHTGMLAQARMRGLDLATYLEQDHPVQKTILNVFAEMCGVKPEEIELGVDGCSAPVFSIPLYNAAFGYARLADPAGLPPQRAAACRVIGKAMTAHPNMVAGPGRFDTHLMETCGGRVISKGGAEGYQGIGVLPGDGLAEDRGLGIAIKIADGDLSGRAVPLCTLEVLRQLGVVGAGELERLQKFYTRPVLNWGGLEVGEIRPVLELDDHD